MCLPSVKVKRVAFVMLLLLAIHACGFQLRGSINVSDDIAPVYLQQNSFFELAREVKSLLLSNKIEIVDDTLLAKTQLTLLTEEKASRVLSVDARGQAQEYLLTYKADILIKAETTEEIRETVVVRRDLVFDSAAVLGFANEANIIYKDMRKQAARLILLKLQALVRNAEPAITDAITTEPAAMEADTTEPVATEPAATKQRNPEADY